ncbi:DUF2628 domain-containing protein [Candidatus Nitrospira bockiana]
MKACEKCGQMNPDDARFCAHCGGLLTGEPGTAATAVPSDATTLWRAFIGPRPALLFSWTSGWSWAPPDDYYLRQFQKFQSGSAPRFALTWHWPAFLLDPFLWFLYRKMYLYALVYAVGPVVSAYLTGDFTVGIVWRIMAGASANYIYFWHIKEHLSEVARRRHATEAELREEIRDRGGVQPYVIWLAVVLHVLLFLVLAQVIREGPPPSGPFQPGKVKPAVAASPSSVRA